MIAVGDGFCEGESASETPPTEGVAVGEGTYEADRVLDESSAGVCCARMEYSLDREIASRRAAWVLSPPVARKAVRTACHWASRSVRILEPVVGGTGGPSGPASP